MNSAVRWVGETWDRDYSVQIKRTNDDVTGRKLRYKNVGTTCFKSGKVTQNSPLCLLLPQEIKWRTEACGSVLCGFVRYLNSIAYWQCRNEPSKQLGSWHCSQKEVQSITVLDARSMRAVSKSYRHCTENSIDIIGGTRCEKGEGVGRPLWAHVANMYSCKIADWCLRHSW